MQTFSPQLTLAVSLKDEATFANFYAGTNAQIVAELKKTASGAGEQIIYLCGLRGQGSTHLLQACCHYANQHHLSSVYLPLASLFSMTPEVLEGLEALNVICLDDLQVIAGNLEWEQAVFHLFNRIYDAGGKVIMAAHDLPNALHLKLLDLTSRLSWGVIYQLHHLSDAEKLSMLTLRAQGRGIDMPEEVGKYLLTHCPRHVSTLLGALDALDKASLAAQRRLTIPFVKEVLHI